jgi:hypothetical protein
MMVESYKLSEYFQRSSSSDILICKDTKEVIKSIFSKAVLYQSMQDPEGFKRKQEKIHVFYAIYIP